MSNMNILIVGVGGQGTLLASRVLGQMALSQGYDVKVSEVHGMAQRGGSVVTHVRYGKEVFSPLIDPGEADYILAFELMEALRWVNYLKPGGEIIVNEQRISPMPVIMGTAEYPGDPLDIIGKAGYKIISLDALSIAKGAGNVKAVNTVLLGVLSKLLKVEDAVWDKALETVIPAKLQGVNVKAFQGGRQAV